MNLKQWRAFRFVKSVIKGKDSNIVFDTVGDFSFGERLEYYRISPNNGGDFSNVPGWIGIKVNTISLVQKDDEFFTNYLLEFNHNEFDMPERRVLRLYEMARQELVSRDARGAIQSR